MLALTGSRKYCPIKQELHYEGQHCPILSQCTLSLPAENIKRLRFSVFKGVKKRCIGNKWVKESLNPFHTNVLLLYLLGMLENLRFHTVFRLYRNGTFVCNSFMYRIRSKLTRKTPAHQSSVFILNPFMVMLKNSQRYFKNRAVFDHFSALSMQGLNSNSCLYLHS